MSRRLLAILAILGSGPLALALAWPLLAGRLRTAELSVALLTGARDEIVVTGSLHRAAAAEFSLQTLSIEEPGKQPYERRVSLDAERRFELALGQPCHGSYHVGLRTAQADAGKGAEERWLRAPQLVVAKSSPLAPRKVSAQELSFRGLLLVLLSTAAGQVALLAVWFKLSSRGRLLPRNREPEVSTAADRAAG